ncbi:hypothetical protein HWV62_18620 [Athelia sp. TMB]|nr:hypothetical protein HWV62_18620 [Athelia sp. TMB]
MDSAYAPNPSIPVSTSKLPTREITRTSAQEHKHRSTEDLGRDDNYARPNYDPPPAPPFVWAPATISLNYQLLDQILRDAQQAPREETGIAKVMDWKCLMTMYNFELLGPGQKIVFGVDCRNSMMYAYTPCLLGGMTVDLPIIVYNCIEALRSRLDIKYILADQAGFPSQSDQENCRYLIKKYNDDRGCYALELDMKSETTASILFTILKYLGNLPFAVLPPLIVQMLDHWCVNPTETRLQHARNNPAETVTKIPLHQVESKQLAIAAVLFRLIPYQFRFIIFYVMEFLWQLQLNDEMKGTAENMAEKFAASFVVGGDHEQARIVVMWLFKRWEHIWRLTFKTTEANYDALLSKSRAEFESQIPKSSSGAPSRPLKQANSARNPFRDICMSGIEAMEQNLVVSVGELHTLNTDLADQLNHAYKTMATWGSTMPLEDSEELEGHINQLIVQKDKACVELDKAQKMLRNMRGKRAEAEASDSE